MKRLLVPAMLGWLVPAELLAQQSSTAPAATSSDELEKVTVTASRIERSGFQAPTPTTTVSAAELENAGAPDVASFLNTLPAFSPSSTPATTQQSLEDMGANFIDLRGLEPQRTLVLVNSRRHVPTQASGLVDLNVVPTVAISSIEVVTGGASAAWGSDAVAGVVNLIYDTKLSGVKMEAQYGASTHGDAQEQRLSAAFGSDALDGRAHFLIATEYHQSDGVLRQADRDWGSKQWQRIQNPDDTGPGDGRPAFITRQNVNMFIATEGGFILGPDPVFGLEFGPGGTVMPRELGSVISPPFMVGGSGVPLGGNDIALSVPIERSNLLANFHYDLADDLRFFFEGSYSEADAGPGNLVQPFAFGQFIEADNAFMPAELSAIWGGPIVIGRINSDIGFVRSERRSNTHRAVAGFEGKLADRWSWNIYYQHGETHLLRRQPGNLLVDNFALAVDAVRDDNGNIVCRSALGVDPDDPPPGMGHIVSRCVPINLFGVGAPSAAAIAYVTGTSSFEQRVTQDVIAAQTNGDLFDLWAGPLSVAFGAEYRDEALHAQSDPVSQADGFMFGNEKALSGGYDVREAFAEAALPLLAAQPFARSLELNGAIRWTDYSSVGEVTTSKLGLVWSPSDALLLRGTVSRDIRAPNVQELFLSPTRGFFTPFDPCIAVRQQANPVVAANCRAAGLPADFVSTAGVIPTATGGNLDLQEEKADTRTVGIVLSPGFMPGFRASLDWFDIEIDRAIRSTDPQNILDICYSSPSLDNASCGRVSRDSSGQLVQVDSPYLNIASLHTSGVDAEIAYRLRLVDLFASARGDLLLRLLGTHLEEKSESPDGILKVERAGEVGPDNFGLPKWRFNLGVTYDLGRFGAHAEVRYVGGGKIDNTLTAEDLDINDVDARWYLDLSVRHAWELGEGTMELFGGLNNVFDRDPPLAVSNFIQPTATNTGLYDVIGRQFYAGVRLKL